MRLEYFSLIDRILDSAGQKGTGKWTAISALDLGMPVTLIGVAPIALLALVLILTGRLRPDTRSDA